MQLIYFPHKGEFDLYVTGVIPSYAAGVPWSAFVSPSSATAISSWTDLRVGAVDFGGLYTNADEPEDFSGLDIGGQIGGIIPIEGPFGVGGYFSHYVGVEGLLSRDNFQYTHGTSAGISIGFAGGGMALGASYTTRPVYRFCLDGLATHSLLLLYMALKNGPSFWVPFLQSLALSAARNNANRSLSQLGYFNGLGLPAFTTPEFQLPDFQLPSIPSFQLPSLPSFQLPSLTSFQPPSIGL